ncbi:phosphoribosyl-ATP diphosphatase [Pedomonas mirosovicensis]|uniref:phosphoribosyl-ATP diphosphatase n=1 Tax=Pedomonas mirosovicensis TaxID=2908641 RepID=UPI002168EF10|nr:phosphoribosyl-ATP diphosphatase [Pedomonas mirosovicensis]MCH8684034.1 phosphoribosyl-ATP diphosphatase [Pedomonas mirosovicensis]
MTNTPDFLAELYATAIARKGADPESSYVAKLYAKGRAKIAQKVGEEGLETALAAVSEDRAAVVAESADLLFHLAVLWAECGIDPADVAAELARRKGTSGLVEKANRKE